MRHIDSGSLYRAATAARLRDLGTGDSTQWLEADVLDAARARVTLVPAEHSFVPLLDGSPADEAIRGTDVTRHVSTVARMPKVREWVNGLVRDAARANSVVVDGRDIGTVVFPDADVKIFLVADPWERARRRLTQQLERAPTDEEIAEETDRLVHRDARDAQQSAQAAEAILLDTTYLTQEEQVDRIVAVARAVTSRADDTSIG